MLFITDIGKCSLTLHGIPVSTRVIVFSDGHPTPVDIIQGRDRLSKELHEKAMENIQEIVEDDFKIQIDCVGLSDNVNMVGLYISFLAWIFQRIKAKVLL